MDNKENKYSGGLEGCRVKIDEIDSQIIKLIEERFEVCTNIARIKNESGKAIYDPEREAQKLENIRNCAGDPFSAAGLEAVFGQIMAVSRLRQYSELSGSESYGLGFSRVKSCGRTGRVAFQGIPGAYGHQAASEFFSQDSEFIGCRTFRDVMEMVESGRADYGVLPVENTMTGIIPDVYDQLSRFGNYIAGEHVVKVEHALLALPGADLSGIRTVYSHPQGLLQCPTFLSKHPDWNQASLANTAVSAKKVLDDRDPSQAAIASPQAAAYYGLSVLAENISDTDNNSTKFIIIRSKPEFEEAADSISITFELSHETGSLYRALGFIIYNQINMTKIESRPIKGEKWRYRFFIDIEGNLDELRIRDALNGIGRDTYNFRILGCYKKAE
ncbi:MAG: chorismate mutase [Lachnospiraceae bacterium]|nr:chorismate mutase [Lachnospiraceae bacterium]